MNKNKELVKNTAIISIGKICTQFLSFLLLPLYTSLLTTKDYGTVALITTYQQLLGYIVFFQIEQAVFRFLIDANGQLHARMQQKAHYHQSVLLPSRLFDRMVQNARHPQL